MNDGSMTADQPPLLPSMRSSRRTKSQHEEDSMSSVETVNLTESFARFSDYWNPKIVGEINDTHVKLVKLQGEFIWHHHEVEDELFLVVQGHLLMRLRDRDLRLSEGEFVVIPHGVEHQPVAEDEVHVMLIEPRSTVNTGEVRSERTVTTLERMSPTGSRAADAD
jgi:mannose-6-phosphate isomerase-like protein (cupin superfamily)